MYKRNDHDADAVLFIIVIHERTDHIMELAPVRFSLVVCIICIAIACAHTTETTTNDAVFQVLNKEHDHVTITGSGTISSQSGQWHYCGTLSGGSTWYCGAPGTCCGTPSLSDVDNGHCCDPSLCCEGQCCIKAINPTCVCNSTTSMSSPASRTVPGGFFVY